MVSVASQAILLEFFTFMDLYITFIDFAQSNIWYALYVYRLNADIP